MPFHEHDDMENSSSDLQDSSHTKIRFKERLMKKYRKWKEKRLARRTPADQSFLKTLPLSILEVLKTVVVFVVENQYVHKVPFLLIATNKDIKEWLKIYQQYQEEPAEEEPEEMWVDEMPLTAAVVHGEVYARAPSDLHETTVQVLEEAEYLRAPVEMAVVVHRCEETHVCANLHLAQVHDIPEMETVERSRTVETFPAVIEEERTIRQVFSYDLVNVADHLELLKRFVLTPIILTGTITFQSAIVEDPKEFYIQPPLAKTNAFCGFHLQQKRLTKIRNILPHENTEIGDDTTKIIPPITEENQLIRYVKSYDEVNVPDRLEILRRQVLTQISLTGTEGELHRTVAEPRYIQPTPKQSNEFCGFHLHRSLTTMRGNMPVEQFAYFVATGDNFYNASHSNERITSRGDFRKQHSMHIQNENFIRTSSVCMRPPAALLKNVTDISTETPRYPKMAITEDFSKKECTVPEEVTPCSSQKTRKNSRSEKNDQMSCQQADIASKPTTQPTLKFIKVIVKKKD